MIEMEGSTSIVLSPPDEIAISYTLVVEEIDGTYQCGICTKEKMNMITPHIRVNHVTVGKEETSLDDKDVMKAVSMLKEKWHEGDRICRLCWGKIFSTMEDTYAHDGQIFFKTT